MTSILDRPVPDPGPEVRAAIAKLRARLSQPLPFDGDRVALRRLAERLRRTADVGSADQVKAALEWLRKPLASKESGE